jgi:hypothetical protein
MVFEPTKGELIKFFALDVLHQKERTIKNFSSSEENIAGKLENEWLQEYELIYALQELEDWNLEEPHSS